MISADRLKIDDVAIIDHIDNEAYMGRLLSLGIEQGSEIRVQRIAAMNGARIVSIDGQKFALRKSELEMIFVREK